MQRVELESYRLHSVSLPMQFKTRAVSLYLQRVVHTRQLVATDRCDTFRRARAGECGRVAMRRKDGLARKGRRASRLKLIQNANFSNAHTMALSVSSHNAAARKTTASPYIT